LIEEKSSIARERQRVEVASRSPANARASPTGAQRPPPARAGVGALVIWDCGRTRHVRRNCPRGNASLGDRQAPGTRQAPERER
jgi:hypothetical protein